MPRKRTVKNLPSDSSDDDEPLARLTNGKRKSPKNDDSSSESDIENYLQHPDKIDLDSPFFNLPKEPPSFDKIENDILAGVSRLTDSESDDEPTTQEEITEVVKNLPSTSKLNFGQLHEYAKKMEEAKQKVEEYNAKRRAQMKETTIENLLAAGEAKLGDMNTIKESLHSSDFESCSDSEKEGWEEVKEELKEKEKSLIPKEGLQITVDMPGVVRKKKEVDLLAAIKRRINRVRKENQLLVHKVHLLCWIAHGIYVSSKINSENVLAMALSLLPSEKSYPDGRADLTYLEQILKWFRNAVVNVEKKVPEGKSLEELLEAQITKKEAYDKKMLVYIFVAVMRSLGIHCRLVLSFQVEPLRPPNSDLLSLSANAGASESKEENEKKTKSGDKLKEAKSRSKTNSSSEQARTKKEPKNAPKSDTKDPKPKTTTRSKSTTQENNLTSESKEENEKTKSSSGDKLKETKSRSKSSSEAKNASKSTTQENSLKPKTSTRSKSTSEKDKQVKKSESTKKPGTSKVANTRKLRSEAVIPQVDGANDPKSPTKPNLKKLKQKAPPCPVRHHPKRLKTITKYKDSDSEDDFANARSPFSNKNDSPKTNGANLKKLKTHVPKSVDVRNDVLKLVKKSIKEQKDISKSRTVRKRKSGQQSENDSDYVPEAVNKKRKSEDEFTPKVKVKRRVQVKKDGEDEEKIKRKLGVDTWVEVFLESEEKWVSVDVIKGQVHCVNELFTRASHPVSYILAWNNDNTLKDITRRYCTNYNTVTRKLRIDSKWWSESLKPFTGRKTPRDKEEDDELERQHLEKPLPTSIAEYKNHPLYVLKRHLLKFEALYPPDAPTLGFVRNEPVYSRQCVYTLHSRDIWLKHAKVVKPGEQPYKIVKARPRWDKLSNSIVTGEMLEIFGPWQTQDYEPPTAENGVVPRNAFGNVELFKPCMLPKNTVHLKLPGLNKVARKLNIDCAPALTGFDFHGGWNHPTYDGFIVCEEFADILVAAWDVEQEEIEKREQEKIDKRVYGNWKRLIRGLLIRERLKAKYEFGEPSGSGQKAKKKLATKK
ncbi:hypothetical protein Zmor_020057 [Zophobas morio]|uniref:DNA repair protein complementing XP-C cells-like protein n=1 Tax=Zophobas morio TaxID=2755281 RepID=A0AA38I729_9CUCU|nr:hypothetical protein Zmor_020057 [Zophobas morio]